MTPPPTRRRFLCIAAAFAAGPVATPARALPASWSGRGFGGDISIRLDGPPDVTGPALAAARAVLARAEALFSLHDPGSALSRLNARGRLSPVPSDLADILALSDRLHAATGGLFDPTVQPLWRALATGGDTAAARALVGWDRVRRDNDAVQLAPGQALTLNGIAQGHATDMVTQVLASHGLTRALVNIGEYRALGGPWRLGLSDPAQGLVGTRALTSGAIATSSPAATLVGGHAHILHPAGLPPAWSTVSVEAPSAALADGLSTALCLADSAAIRRLRRAFPEVARITLVAGNGDLHTL